MRVLHLSDTHLGHEAWFRGAPKGWRRADDHLAAMRRVLAPALAEEVDVVVHTGDLFNRSRPPAKAIAAAAAVLADVARVVPTVVMAGNHDRRGVRGHFPDPPPGLTVVDAPCALTVAGLRLGVVPFLREPAAWRAAAAAVCAEGVDALLTHQAFDGSRVPGFTFRPSPGSDTLGEADLPAGVRVILNGHIHTRQNLRLGDAVVHHVGSTERTSFVERDEPKAASVWEPGAGVRTIDAAPRPMVVVRGAADLLSVTPECLVALGRAAQTDAMEAEAQARGGWVAAWAKPTRQVGLFG